MKKILALILMFALLFVTAPAVFAAEPEYLCREQFEALFADSGAEIVGYRELFAHKDNGGATDWVLVQGVTNMMAPMPYRTVIGHRFLSGSAMGLPFSTGYGIYDAENGTFIDAASAAVRSYPGFTAAFDRYGGGRLLGDLDGDGETDIIDVTLIQRCEANMRDYPADDLLPDGSYASDFNRDGARDILDATSIQRYLVGLDDLYIPADSGKTDAEREEYRESLKGYTADDLYSDDTVIVVLYETEEKDAYTSDTFAGYGVAKIKKLESSPILILTLDRHDKQNVLDTTYALYDLSGVHFAHPDFQTFPDSVL